MMLSKVIIIKQNIFSPLIEIFSRLKTTLIVILKKILQKKNVCNLTQNKLSHQFTIKNWF